MKRLSILATTIILVACSSNSGMYSSSGSGQPDVALKLTQLSGVSTDTFYFRGPVNIQYRLTIDNPTSEPITMRQLELQTIGSGSYSLRTGMAPITTTVAPHSSVTIPLSAWGHARGGFFRMNEPVTLRGVAHFESSQGRFLRQFTEIL